MKRGYKKRPQDFKRKILKTNISDKKILLEEEYNWLRMIKNEELGKKYYNLHNHHFGHWSSDENKRLTVGEKISASPNRRENISKANKGRKLKPETIEKLKEITRKQFENEDNRKRLSEITKNMWKDPEYRERQRKVRENPGFYKGFRQKHTEESKLKMSEKKKGKATWNKGKILSHLHGTHWYNNGIINVKRKECPKGFNLGRIKNKEIMKYD